MSFFFSTYLSYCLRTGHNFPFQINVRPCNYEVEKLCAPSKILTQKIPSKTLTQKNVMKKKRELYIFFFSYINVQKITFYTELLTLKVDLHHSNDSHQCPILAADLLWDKKWTAYLYLSLTSLPCLDGLSIFYSITNNNKVSCEYGTLM